MRALITGGTGTIGRAIAQRLGPGGCVIFSNDENSIFETKEELGRGYEYVLGDVRDYDAICNAMHQVDAVYHCGALKHVDICEANPMQAIQTNVLGTANVKKACMGSPTVKTMVLISTDKAVNPIGVMGATKLLAERLMYDATNIVRFVTVRFGNVWESRGSLKIRIEKQIAREQPISITDPNMERYFMSVKSAVDLIEYSRQWGEDGDIYIPKMTLVPLPTIIKEILSQLKARPDYPQTETGRRQGEKMREELMTELERDRSVDYEKWYRIPRLPF